MPSATVVGNNNGSIHSGEHIDVAQNVTAPVETNSTIDIVIKFTNFTARANASLPSTVNVTGGADIQLVPVLFATAPPSVVPQIRSVPEVTDVSRDRQVQTRTIPAAAVRKPEPSADTTISQTVPWGVQRVGAEQVTDRLRRNATQDVTVAILDTGIDNTHPDLTGRVVWGANFTRGTEQYGQKTSDDNNGHGTAVAGIIAAEDNNQDVVGIAPGTQLYSVKVLRANNAGTISSVIKGINAAIEGPDGVIKGDDSADIVHMSVGTTVANNQLASAVSAASEHAILVTSAGNRGDNDPTTAELTYPAAYPETIAVAATNRENKTTAYSSEGPGIDVAAPGTGIETLSVKNGTQTFSGTSAAAPHASGALALLLATDQTIDNDTRTRAALCEVLTNNSQDIEDPGIDPFSGHGLLRIDRAVAALVLNSSERTLDKTVLSAGSQANATVTAYAAGDHLTISESFTPPFANTTIKTVQINEELTTSASRIATDNSTTATVVNLKIGDTVTVRYRLQTMTIPPPNRQYQLTGTVTTGGREYSLNTTTLSVTNKSTTELIDTYDTNGDQNIDASELGTAIIHYGSGKITATELNAVMLAYLQTTRQPQ